MVYIKYKPVKLSFEKNQDEEFSTVLAGLLGGVLFIFAGVGLIAVAAPRGRFGIR